MRREEKTLPIECKVLRGTQMFSKRTQSFSVSHAYARELKTQFFLMNAIVLQEKADLLLENAKFHLGTQNFCERT